MKKVLIIEDDLFTANIYRDQFQTSGFEVDIAVDAVTGMDKLLHNPPSVVLLDLMLPEISGVEVIKFIRSQPTISKLPVLVLSSAYVGSTVEAARKAGADMCLTKTECTPSLLVEAVQSVLATYESEAELGDAVPAEADPVTISSPGKDEYRLSVSPQELQARMKSLLIDMRHHLSDLISSDEATRLPRLLAFYRRVHAFSASASLARFQSIDRLGSVLEALVNEVHVKPDKLNASTFRTIAQAVDLLVVLMAKNDETQDEGMATPQILVLDDDLISREAVCEALERAHLSALSLSDSSAALALLEKTRFDLVFLDVDMPGLNGFEVSKKLHAIPMNAKTPVVFVTRLTDFGTRAHSASCGAIDFIAKPVNMAELAVKATIHLLSQHFSPAPILSGPPMAPPRHEKSPSVRNPIPSPAY